MSLETIKYYLDLNPNDPNTATERLALLKEQKEKIEAKIADLQKTLQYIEYKADLYQDRVSESKARSLPYRSKRSVIKITDKEGCDLMSNVQDKVVRVLPVESEKQLPKNSPPKVRSRCRRLTVKIVCKS